MLARQSWEFVADYDAAVFATLNEHNVSPQLPQFVGLFKQASGLFRQMAHIVELIEWTKPAITFVRDDRHDYRAWRYRQFDRIASNDIGKLVGVAPSCCLKTLTSQKFERAGFTVSVRDDVTAEAASWYTGYRLGGLKKAS